MYSFLIMYALSNPDWQLQKECQIYVVSDPFSEIEECKSETLKQTYKYSEEGAWHK
jgi:hypothetical protein